VRPERESDEQPEKMLDLMALRPGQTVADIGAGVGFHTVRLAKRVGPAGRVYATDVQPDMIAALERGVRAAGLGNVTPVLTDGASTGLPPGTIGGHLRLGADEAQHRRLLFGASTHRRLHDHERSSCRSPRATLFVPSR
jgi:SAM-dependent methyltransferase